MPTARMLPVAKCHRSFRCRVLRQFIWASSGKETHRHPKYFSTPDFLNTHQTTWPIPPWLISQYPAALLVPQDCSSTHPCETCFTVSIRSSASELIAQQMIPFK